MHSSCTSIQSTPLTYIYHRTNHSRHKGENVTRQITTYVVCRHIRTTLLLERHMLQHNRCNVCQLASICNPRDLFSMWHHFQLYAIFEGIYMHTFAFTSIQINPHFNTADNSKHIHIYMGYSSYHTNNTQHEADCVFAFMVQTTSGSFQFVDDECSHLCSCQ